MNVRHLTARTSAIALLAALALCALVAPRAGAVEAVYGGLGRVGASVIKPGSTGANGLVNPFSDHNFAVDAATGDFYIADEFSNEGQSEARIQKFGAKGEFLAENRVKLSAVNGAGLGGMAVDAAHSRVYLLVDDIRPGESETTRTKIETKENAQASKEEQLVKAEEKKEEAKAKELKEQIAKLEEEIHQLEEELPVFDEEARAAGEIWSFSTSVKEGKLKEPKVLAKSTVLQPLSEEAKVALVHPTGIAVDPTSHDIVIAGQEDESTRKGPGEEELRAAVQRVHENGELGPRYVDNGNCLDQGVANVAEPACAEEKPHEEFPRSPIVTPQGRVYVEVTQESGQIWEIPATTEPTAAFKEVNVLPKRIFTLTNRQKLLSFTGEEEIANTMSFASLGGGEGRIYLDASVEGEPGLLVLDYKETAGVVAVSERGWTAGQSKASTQEKCVVPPGSPSVLLGAAGGENVLMLSVKPEVAPEPALVGVFAFGQSGQACGHVEVTPPKVELGLDKEAKEAPAGATTTLTSQVVGANANVKSVKWKFKYKAEGGAEGEEVAESGYQFEAISLNHDFMHAGEYEITESVETDNLGSPHLEVKATQKLIVTAPLPKVTLKAAHPAPIRAGESVPFETTVTDENEAKPHLTYIWHWGDGSAVQEEAIEASEAKSARTVPHSFLTRCTPSCTVVLEVKDGVALKAGRTSVEVNVGESVAEEEAKATRAAEEAARIHGEEVKRAEEEAAVRVSAEQRHAAEEAAAKRKTEEEAAAAKRRAEEEARKPEARVAGTSLGVTPNGAVSVKLSCPVGETACAGTITLRTLNAVSAGKKAILTLASGSFSVSGGQVKTLTLHLSAKARRLLAKTHSLRALALVSAHDAAGKTSTTRTTVLLRVVKKHGH
jgi:hypothetical protein